MAICSNAPLRARPYSNLRSRVGRVVVGAHDIRRDDTEMQPQRPVDKAWRRAYDRSRFAAPLVEQRWLPALAAGTALAKHAGITHHLDGIAVPRIADHQQALPGQRLAGPARPRNSARPQCSSGYSVMRFRPGSSLLILLCLAGPAMAWPPVSPMVTAGCSRASASPHGSARAARRH